MIELDKEIDFSEYTALLPSIAVGNVAQLAIDLLIATIEMKRIGSGWHSGIMNIFGPPAYQHDKINKTTSIEIYYHEYKKLFAFQFRAPLVTSLTKDFHNELINFIKNAKFKNILILSSAHAYEKHFIEAPQFEYITTDKFININKECIEKQNWLKFNGEKIYGGGNGKKLFELCAENDICTFLLFKYVSEGDNSSDASELLAEINNLYKIFDNKNGRIKLTVPISWNCLYGNEPPELIF